MIPRSPITHQCARIFVGTYEDVYAVGATALTALTGAEPETLRAAAASAETLTSGASTAPTSAPER